MESIIEMIDLFSLETHQKYTQDEFLRAAAQYRLIHQAKTAHKRDKQRRHPDGFREVFGGVLYRVLVSGPKLMVTEMFYQKHAATPLHAHSSEQAGYVLSGRLRLVIDGEERTMAAGDHYLVTSGKPHSLQALTGAVVIDVFSPPREEYLTPRQRSELSMSP